MRVRVRLPLAVALPLLLAGCGIAPVAERPTPGAVVGDYYRGDHTGSNIYLTLNADSSYHATWRGCVGEYGTSAGVWRVVDDRVELEPQDDSGKRVEEIRVLHALRYRRELIFVADLNDRYYKRYGPDDSSAFYRQGK